MRPQVLLCGIPSEPPLAMVLTALEGIGACPLVFNQRRCEAMDIELAVIGEEVQGSLHLGDRCVQLDDVSACYLRSMDFRFLPELEGAAPNSPEYLHAEALHEALLRWSEVTPARVVNRVAAMGSNVSKPYQAQLIGALGFLVPETVITDDPSVALEFVQEHEQVIYKSISGTRSIVRRFDQAAQERLADICWCPVQFQRWIDGTDVRVHTVARQAFATAIDTRASDYRYARAQGFEAPELREFDLSPELARRCADLSDALGLAFAGIDLRVTRSGDVYCFEVNPCPAFSYYELNTGQPIAAALARFLAGADG